MTPPSGSPIRGRREERKLLHSQVDLVRDGFSTALVLVGEAGIGKTRLLDHVAEQADGVQVTRVAGAEAETHLAFAALHRLLGPFLGRRDRLPAPQRTALDTAFGLVGGPPPDIFLIGLAALTILGEAAGEQPVLVLVDDAHWLDRESRAAIAFLGRRLDADAIGLFIGTRDDPGALASLQGLETLTLAGLADEDARELISSGARGRLDARVARRILDAGGGNPLALLEMTGALSDEQRAGGSVVPEPLPIGPRLESYFTGQILQMPRPTRTLLLLVAIAPADDQAVLWRAAERLGVDPLALDAAAGVLRPGRRPEIRHPLIRSAVYGSASAAERRAVHAALGEAVDGERNPDGRAWHRAESVLGLDDSVAEELEQASDRARGRGGYAAQAAFLARAADLTADPERRAERLLAAARPYLFIGDSASAADQLDQVAPDLARRDLQAERQRLQATVSWYAGGRVAVAPRILLDALNTFGPLDIRLTRDMLSEALAAGIMAGRHTQDVTLLEIATTARQAPPPPDRTLPDALLDAYAARIAGDFTQSVPLLRAAVEAQLTGDLSNRSRILAVGSGVAFDLWDDEGFGAVAARADAFNRGQGALHELHSVLYAVAAWKMINGRFSEAEAAHDEGSEIAAAVGLPPIGVEHRIALLAWQGREEETRAGFEYTRQIWVEQLGYAVVENHALNAMLILELSLGRYRDALPHAHQAFAADMPGEGNIMLADILEAAVRGGDPDLAEAAGARLSERAGACGTPWGLGLRARGQALLTDDAEPLFQESLDLLRRTSVRTDLARSHLLYGEWLRRAGRRTDARAQLRTAHEMFTTMGAAGFAERARTELQATGESVRRRATPSDANLTPREFQVAGLVSAGATNTEVATQLFVTASTVEFHLNKIFRKLGITSRRQLAQVMNPPGR